MWTLLFVVLLINGDSLPITRTFDLKNTCELELKMLRKEAIEAMKEDMILGARGSCTSSNVESIM